ncbi:hypothetical protein ACTNEO_11005 [Gracilibacillus sp. HCP3S3_G5_1]|uniref:hypothetical protein n=1 Tax=unclassified Gracilibacillus TaxID=2625209 RepID=UPI003F894CED
MKKYIIFIFTALAVFITGCNEDAGSSENATNGNETEEVATEEIDNTFDRIDITLAGETSLIHNEFDDIEVSYELKDAYYLDGIPPELEETIWELDFGSHYYDALIFIEAEIENLTDEEDVSLIPWQLAHIDSEEIMDSEGEVPNVMFETHHLADEDDGVPLDLAEQYDLIEYGERASLEPHEKVEGYFMMTTKKEILDKFEDGELELRMPSTWGSKEDYPPMEVHFAN